MSMQLENLEITARENLMISFFVLFLLILWIIEGTNLSATFS